MNVDVLGGLRRKTITRSRPPVKDAKWWMRSSVSDSLASEVDVGDKRRARSWRLVLGGSAEVSRDNRRGMAKSWVSSLLSATVSAMYEYDSLTCSPRSLKPLVEMSEGSTGAYDGRLLSVVQNMMIGVNLSPLARLRFVCKSRGEVEFKLQLSTAAASFMSFKK